METPVYQGLGLNMSRLSCILYTNTASTTSKPLEAVQAAARAPSGPLDSPASSVPSFVRPGPVQPIMYLLVIECDFLVTGKLHTSIHGAFAERRSSSAL